MGTLTYHHLYCTYHKIKYYGHGFSKSSKIFGKGFFIGILEHLFWYMLHTKTFKIVQKLDKIKIVEITVTNTCLRSQNFQSVNIDKNVLWTKYFTKKIVFDKLSLVITVSIPQIIKRVKYDLLIQNTVKVPVGIYIVNLPPHKKWETCKPRGRPFRFKCTLEGLSLHFRFASTGLPHFLICIPEGLTLHFNG